MSDLADNAEFFALLNELIDKWCDRRALRPLSRMLGPYLAFNLTACQMVGEKS
jgi:hypothetical protein